VQPEKIIINGIVARTARTRGLTIEIIGHAAIYPMFKHSHSKAAALPSFQNS
jgi:hypothetical protein